MTREKKGRLGRGLGVLLGEHVSEAPSEGEVQRVRPGEIESNPFQPRREFSEADLGDLRESIRENGLLQPLVVRPSPGASRSGFELVAGERRLRAVRELGWDVVPVVIRKVDDRTLLVLALVENLQREALNPLEEAEGYRVLSDDFGLTQEEIAHSIGKDRSTVANLLRLLRLPPSIRALLSQGKLSMGHARALLAVKDPVRAGELARRTVREDWSVREVERRVRKLGASPEGTGKKGGGESGVADPALRALQEELREVLATRVQISGARGGGGRIQIPYDGLEELERLFALIAGREASDVLG